MSEFYAGVDEVGRGCLAGPVVACAVVLPYDFCVPVQDSKQCTPEQRSLLSDAIKASGASYALGIVEHDVIDDRNIRNATFLAMAQAISRLVSNVHTVYIDGNAVIPEPIMQEYGLSCKQYSLVRGDMLNPSISSASILAKVYRDSLMQGFSQLYPEYGFERHKGYGTKEHRDALKKYGPCPIHRRTFAGVL